MHKITKTLGMSLLKRVFQYISSRLFCTLQCVHRYYFKFDFRYLSNHITYNV